MTGTKCRVSPPSGRPPPIAPPHPAPTGPRAAHKTSPRYPPPAGLVAIAHRVLGILAAGLISMVSDAASPRNFLAQPDAWFASPEARQIASNILSYQSDLGGWPKNRSTTDQPFPGNRSELAPTFDNGATTDELRFLARMVAATHDDAYRTAFHHGLDYILDGQFPEGGWPQFHPPGKGYHRHITFNDHAMVRLMEFLRDVPIRDRQGFVDDSRRKRAKAAFDRGIECILKCQIKVRGSLTAWCAQHDEIDYRPRPARAFELASLSGSESVGITRLLMSLDDPSPEVIRAVEAAVAWFERSKLVGLRVDVVPDPKAPKGMNKVVVEDRSAPALWARFYDLESNRPLFADRDGLPKTRLSELGYERRNGYAWYGTWPQRLLENDYPAWKKRLDAGQGRRLDEP